MFPCLTHHFIIPLPLHLGLPLFSLSNKEVKGPGAAACAGNLLDAHSPTLLEIEITVLCSTPVPCHLLGCPTCYLLPVIDPANTTYYHWTRVLHSHSRPGFLFLVPFSLSCVFIALSRNPGSNHHPMPTKDMWGVEWRKEEEGSRKPNNQMFVHRPVTTTTIIYFMDHSVGPYSQGFFYRVTILSNPPVRRTRTFQREVSDTLDDGFPWIKLLRKIARLLLTTLSWIQSNKSSKVVSSQETCACGWIHGIRSSTFFRSSAVR